MQRKTINRRTLIDPESLAGRLRAVRIDRGLTQLELGKAALSNQAVIQKIENGRSLLPRIVFRLSVVLDVNPAWLLFGDAFASKEYPAGARRD